MLLLRVKTHIRQEIDINILKSIKKNITLIRATSVFITAFKPVA